MRIRFVFCHALALLLSIPSNSITAHADDEAPTLGAVIETATNVLQKVKAELENKSYPPLRFVTMNVTTATSEKTDGGLKTFVVNVSSSAHNEQTRKLSIKLGSSPYRVKVRNNKTNIIAGRGRAISDIIAQDLKANLEATFRRLSRHDNDANDPLSTDTVTFAFGFKVAKSTSSSTGLTFEPASLTFGNSSSPTNTNEFVFEFGKPK